MFVVIPGSVAIAGLKMVGCLRGENAKVVVCDTKSCSELFNRTTTKANRGSVSVSPKGQGKTMGLSHCRMESWDLAAWRK